MDLKFSQAIYFMQLELLKQNENMFKDLEIMKWVPVTSTANWLIPDFFLGMGAGAGT